MRKRKKNRRQKSNFYLGVTLYTLFSVAAVVLIVVIFSDNIHTASGINRERVSVSSDSGLNNDWSIQYYKTMADVETYIYQNMGSLAQANSAGNGKSIVDGVDFINIDRALVFYHENTDKYLAEVVFNDNNNQAKIERFILKVKNDNDYSRGVYGTD
jgi:hypothetical protein